MRSFDVAVVGGGIIGGSIAFELTMHKLRVVLLDRKEPGQEASWAAAGMLAPAPESPDAMPLVPLGRASLERYPRFVAAVEEASGSRVGYRREGTLELIFNEEAEREPGSRLTLHQGLGLPAEALEIERARELEPTLSSEARAAVLLSYEASVDNRALTAAVLAAASARGAEIRARADVQALVREGNRCVGVIAGGEKISAAQVVIAAGCYSGALEGVAPYAPTRPVRGQMMALRSAKVQIRRVLRSPRGYIVPRGNGLFVAGSTSENVGFEKSVTPAGLAQILRTALELAPGLADAAVVESWSGLRPDTPDHLPLLGPTDIEGLVIATGHYRNGILLAPITAKLIGEWLVERKSFPAGEAFSPLRFLEARRERAV